MMDNDYMQDSYGKGCGNLFENYCNLVKIPDNTFQKA